MFVFNPVEIQMSAVEFTAKEEAGVLSRELGLVPLRTSQPPRSEVPSWSVKFAHPPLPSASRAAPRRS